MEYLFKDFRENEKVYKENIRFWRKTINNIISKKRLKLKNQSVILFDEWNEETNPAFYFRLPSLNKQIAIVQRDPDEPNLRNPFSLWIKETCHLKNWKHTYELTIFIDLNNETLIQAQEAIQKWFYEDLSFKLMNKYIKTIDTKTNNELNNDIFYVGDKVIKNKKHGQKLILINGKEV